jgi:HEAT repeat protein
MNPLLLAAVLALPVGSIPIVSQDAQETADERADIKDQLDLLKGHVKSKGKEDVLAIGVIDQLTQEFEDTGPKDRAAIVKGLEACFKAKRTKELEPGVPDDRLYFAAATALGRMGPESVKGLAGLLGNKSHRKNLRLQARIAKSLGNTRDPKGIKPLEGLLKHKDMELQAAGAEALGNFDDLDLKQRKEIFKSLLDTMMGQKSKKDTSPNDFEAADRWNAISGPIIASLQRISGHDERDPAQWQRWWNKNKKADWDDTEE